MNEIFFGQPRTGLMKRARKLVWKAAGSCALGGLYAGRFDDHWFRIERRDMPLRGLGGGFDGATVAHISDLHCSPLVLQRYLRRCVELINSLGTDFVAITGDFITGSRHYADRVAKILHGLRPKIATVACLGNHDYGIYHPRGLGGKRGLAEFLTGALTHADVFVMLNESRSFHRNGSTLQFVGVEDFWSTNYNPYVAFEMARSSSPVVALVHNPDAAQQVANCGAQWVLSGHTHGSEKPELITDMVLPTTCKNFVGGQYDLPGDRRLYVNRGLGYARRSNLNTRPEITLFTLRQA